MTRLVERCAACGVEHESRAAECEACGGALRWWCRAHSGSIGWLESADCRGCAEEKARPRPRPRPVASPPSAAPAPARRTASEAEPAAAPLVLRGLRPRALRYGHEITDPARRARERHALYVILRTMLVCAVFIAGAAESRAPSVEAGVKLGSLVAIVLACWYASRKVSTREAPRRREPLPAHEWVEAHLGAVLVPVLWTLGVCVVVSMMTGVYIAVRRDHDVSEYLGVYLFQGLITGVFAGGVVSSVRMAWLSRRGGPLDSRRRPV